MKKEWLVKTLTIGITFLCLCMSTVPTIASPSFKKYWLMIDTLQGLHGITKTESQGINATLDGVRGENGWFVDVPVYLVITPDNDTQIEKVFIRINSGSWQELTWMGGEPIPLIIISDGILQLYVKIYDSEWNEWYFSFEYKVDTRLPTIVLQKKNMFFNKLKFIADVSDQISGVWRVEFYLDDDLKFTDYDTPFEWIWEGTGNHTINAKVFDWAGLSANSSLNIYCVKNRSQNLQIILLLKKPNSTSSNAKYVILEGGKL
jgi:hypothetical protein